MPSPFERTLTDALTQLQPPRDPPSSESQEAAKSVDECPSYRWVVTPIRDPVTGLIVQVVWQAVPRDQPIPTPAT